MTVRCAGGYHIEGEQEWVSEAQASGKWQPPFNESERGASTQSVHSASTPPNGKVVFPWPP